VRRALPRLHAVTDDTVLVLPDYATRVAALADAGAIALHVRSGTWGGARLCEVADRTRRALDRSDASLIVNDRADIARSVNAHGVHLPGQGLSIGAARALVGGDRWVGRSTHHPDEANAAIGEGADYVFLGPIWTTASHPDRAPIGPEALHRVQGAPVIAIGGITAERVGICLAHGAYGVAVISALWKTRDPGASARRLWLSFDV